MKFIPLACILLLPLVARAGLDSDFDALAARQHGEGGSCDKFRRKWHSSVAKGGLNGDSPSHTSKEQALDAVNLLEKFRFHGVALDKAWRFLVENREEIAKLPDQAAWLKRMAQLEQPCEVFSRHVHRQLLLKDVAALHLGKKDVKKIDRDAKDYLRHGGAGDLVGVGMKAAYLALYLNTLYDGENRDELRARASALVKAFDDGRERIKPEMKALSVAGKGETIEYWFPTFELWSRVDAELEAIQSAMKD
jgi:hypothetical protein